MNEQPNIQKRRGRPPKIAAAERAKLEHAVQNNIDIDEEYVDLPTRSTRTQTTTRQTMNEHGRVAVKGRDGEVLTRKRVGGIDPFYIDPAMIPDGWTYQWNAISIVGNQEILADQNLRMVENGWRPVPASRHPGLFTPVGHQGSIIRGQQRLDERPIQLTEEAREEEIGAARQLISDRNEALMLSGVRSKLPDGYAMDGKYRGTGGRVSMNIDPALDVPRPAVKTEE